MRAYSNLGSIVASRMENGVRNKLYRSVVVQDIAFFDGTTTGEITSRLYGDAVAMISPAQGMLRLECCCPRNNLVFSTLLSSIITLCGGLVMCIFTSWRLSLLAFTTVGPIVLVTKVYAKWAQKIAKWHVLFCPPY